MKIVKSISAAKKGRPFFVPEIEVNGSLVKWKEFEFCYGDRKRLIPAGEFIAEYDPMLDVTYYLCVGMNTGSRVVVEYEGLKEQLVSEDEPSGWIIRAFIPCNERKEKVVEYRQFIQGLE